MAEIAALAASLFKVNKAFSVLNKLQLRELRQQSAAFLARRTRSTSMNRWLLGVALAAFVAAPALAHHNANHSTGHSTVEGVILDTSTTTNRFMGNSQNAPPNENAAASRGVRTETTTTTTTGDVTGPSGQLSQGNYDCNNCTTTNVQTTTTTTSSGPGNSNP